MNESKAVLDYRDALAVCPFASIKLEAAMESVIAELEAAKRDRDQAIHEANRRDQKWMDGIDEIMGRKLDYHDPTGRNAASTALGKLKAQLEAMTKERDEARAALQAK